MDERKNQDVLVKEIDLIQSCINRMAQNSFFIKGWTVSLISVLIALLPEKVDVNIVCILGIVITLCFWYLDGFFLKTEKLFRMKYNWVIQNRAINDKYFYDLNPYNKDMWLEVKSESKVEGQRVKLESQKQPTIISTMFSKTLFPMYLMIIIPLIIWLRFNNI